MHSLTRTFPAPSDSPGRVLFVVSDLGKNGITVYVKTLAQALLDRGYSVALAATSFREGAPLNPEITQRMGMTFYPVDFPDPIRKQGSLFMAPRAFADMVRIVRAFRPNVIHAQGLGVAPYAYVAAKQSGAALVSTCHCEPPDRTRALARRCSIAMLFLNVLFGNRLIALSHDMERILSELWSVKKDRIRLVHYGSNADHFRPPTDAERESAREAHRLKQGDFVVSIIARLEGVKKHNVLLDAAALLRSWGLPIVVLVAGEGPLRREIEQQIEEKDLSGTVRMLGFTDARRVLWASDAFVLPSAREAFPIVVAEAMLCGVVPVRTPASGATDQIEHGVNGYIVPFDDPHALARALRTLAERPALRANMAQVSLEKARKLFTTDQMIQGLIETYESVSNGARIQFA